MLLEMTTEDIDGQQVQCLRFVKAQSPLHLSIRGFIGNSVTDGAAGRAKTVAWKVAVSTAVKAARGMTCWDPRLPYAVTVAFSFHLRSHGNRSLDVENYLKPTIDAVAAGLFCTDDHELATTPLWAYDDSNFHHLLVHRLTDVTRTEDEGLRLAVSVAP